MLGFGFKSRVISILHDKFDYPVSRMQMPILNGIAAQAKLERVNEYDAAIMFMLVMMNSLSGVDSTTTTFVKIQIRNVESMLSMALSPYAELNGLLDQVAAKFGIERG